MPTKFAEVEKSGTLFEIMMTIEYANIQNKKKTDKYYYEPIMLQIANVLNKPHSSISDGLKKLSKKGYIYSEKGKVKRTYEVNKAVLFKEYKDYIETKYYSIQVKNNVVNLFSYYFFHYSASYMSRKILGDEPNTKENLIDFFDSFNKFLVQALMKNESKLKALDKDCYELAKRFKTKIYDENIQFFLDLWLLEEGKLWKDFKK